MGSPVLTAWDVSASVTGYASMRWRGARNRAEAIAKNQALSEQRARNVRAVVEQILKKELPNHPVPVAMNAHGALRSPDIQGADDNEPFTRIVHVKIYMMTLRHTERVMAQRPMRVDAHTSLWYLRVAEFFPLGFGVAGANLTIVLRNPVSDKQTTYLATVWGGGLAAKPTNWLSKKLPKGGDEVFFMTNKDMGFNDFDGQWIRVGTVEAKYGIGYGYSYLSFVSLGSEAEQLAFDQGVKVGWPAAAGAVMSGKLELKGYNPGDYFEFPLDDKVISINDKKEYLDGVVVTFPTGKSNYSDLSQQDRRKLEDFVTNKARAAKILQAL